MSRVRQGALLFGGSGRTCLHSDLWLLKCPSAEEAAAEAAGAGDGSSAVFMWKVPTTEGTSPVARAFHTASVRASADAEGVEQLLVCGGSNSHGRLSDLHCLSLPSFTWSCPRVNGTPPSGRCWHAAAAPPTTTTFRMLVFGGVDSTGSSLRDCHLLTPLIPAVDPGGSAVADKGGKDKGAKKKEDKKAKGAAEEAPLEGEGEDTRPVEFEWRGLPASSLKVRTEASSVPAGEEDPTPRLMAPAGPVAVATADHSVLIFGGGAELLHLYQPEELFGDDEMTLEATQGPPTLSIRSVCAAGLSTAQAAAALSSECLIVVSRADTAEELGSAPLLAAAGKLTCSSLVIDLPADETYSDGNLNVELRLANGSLGSYPLGRRHFPPPAPGEPLRAPGVPTDMAVDSQPLVGGDGGGAAVTLSFDFVRRGAPSKSDLNAVAPAIPSPDDSARRVLGEKKGLGAAEIADEYTGGFLDGLPSGEGVCQYASGARYEGQWERGLRHGHGELRDERGSVYKGGFKDGECAGIGAWHYADGSTYTGPMYRGLREGQGVYRSAIGDVYEGEWKADERSGYGVDVSGEGLVVYKGHWLDDKRHGQGVLTIRESHKSSRTETYDGMWRLDARHGPGKFTWPNGDVYEGNWQSNLRNGHGVLTTPDGEVYDGKWVGDVKCGEGRFRAGPHGEVYFGQWFQSQRNGIGQCDYPDGSTYKGNWRDGQQHGSGYWQHRITGESYRGSWSAGQRHGDGLHRTVVGDEYRGSYHANLRSGKGTLLHANGARYEGEWREGLQAGIGEHWETSGEYYKGEWKDGERCGSGRCVYASGDVYEGEWHSGRRHGHGTNTYAQPPDLPSTMHVGFTPRDVQIDRQHAAGAAAGRPYSAPASQRKAAERAAETMAAEAGATGPILTAGGVFELSLPPVPSEDLPPAQYDGQWVDDKRAGVGKMCNSSGEVYEGEWADNVRHGHGTCMYPDGECYIGHWVNGERQGSGSLAN